MKRFVICIAVVVMAVVVGKKNSSTKELTNDVLLMNVEALATPEEGNVYHCFASGNVCCPFTLDKVQYVYRPFNLE